MQKEKSVKKKEKANNKDEETTRQLRDNSKLVKIQFVNSETHHSVVLGNQASE